ncbi:hypothetical protein H2201_006009 [Coniosporium apollinis]|uniref:Amine oxidase n=1 Tax=Coniosporium apollinis TaxID=61459 RepID=A0ABQ9NN72_9PEZI|nr:hypothetical protein H2201_006009 [Coniosporium apollinis]
MQAETVSVAEWLFAQPALNLTVSENATEWDNTVALIELMVPGKAEVLTYLNSNGSAPLRYAHVVVDHRATTEPYLADLLVGPLPIRNGTTRYEPLTYPYTKSAGGRVRNLDADSETMSAWFYNISASIEDITQELWGGTATGADEDTLDLWGIDPPWQDDGRIIRWTAFWNLPTSDFDVETLLPLGLYFKADVTGRDPTGWSVEGWFYNGIFYSTTDEFRSAFYSPGFVKLPPNEDGLWGQTGQRGPVPPLDTAYPPTMVAPSGPRFFVDEQQQYVKWMDFEFYLGFSRDIGLSLHDIKYKGQRIIYELSLQEAIAHYAGQDPMQSGTAYLDSFYGFGPYAFELVKGYDCPPHATYLNSSFYVRETTHTHTDSICLFEMDAPYPMQRHSTGSYVSAAQNVYFTVRTVNTVGNYDYMFSYEFYMDGTIDVNVRASGYIQAAYFANNHDYGYQIHSALSGSMHDHVLNYKIDFDILGTANTMIATTLVPVSETYPWSGGKPRNTMKLVRETVASEDNSRLLWGANGATQYTIVNTDQPNRHGEPRGYRILPSLGTAHLTVQDSSNVVNAANWATHDIYVTRQKDSEPRAAHPYNSQDVFDPPIDFAKFFDGESLLQEDLVVWVNLGMHHVPHTGDLPNTVFTTSHNGVQIMPLNYLEGDPSMESVQQVKIEYKAGEVGEVETYGQPESSCQAEWWGYKGDSVVRKFPYAPGEVYYETEDAG